MPTGTLVIGTDALPLTEQESHDLRDYLTIIQAEGHTDAYRMIFFLIRVSLTNGSLDEMAVLRWCISQYCSNHECDNDHHGILASEGPHDPAFMLRKNELKTLSDTLATLRTKSWFATWLAARVEKIASATSPADRIPAPLSIMGSLTNDAEQFETLARSTRDFVNQRPDLFATPRAQSAVRSGKQLSAK